MDRTPNSDPQPRVCVVMPAYNAAAFITRAIQSVLAQTVKDLELMVIDDGSQDETASIVERITDDRIHFFTGPNRGPSTARNVGWRAACRSCEYVAYIDADDYWEPAKLERQLTCLDQNPTCVAVGAFMRYVSAREFVLGQTGQTLAPEDQRKVASAELFPFPTSSLVVRRRVVDRVNGFDETLDRVGAEDLDFLARVAQFGQVACVPEVLGSYRIHASSTMAREQRRLSRGARFVQRRLAAQRAGSDLQWEAFASTDRPTLRERRQETVAVCYRAAALAYAEGRGLRALAFGLLASAIDPTYTIRRLQRQRTQAPGSAVTDATT